jgi:hypothetical protein
LEMEILNETLENTKLDKGKHKAEADLSDFWEDSWWDQIPKAVSNLTRSGRVYQPSNLQ